MLEKKYRVVDVNGFVLASDMTIEMAVVFVKGFIHEFYNERVALSIEELATACGVKSDEMEFYEG